MTIAEITLALLLARTCVAEIGFQEESSVEECQLMWQVNARNAKRSGRSLTRQTLRFNSFWKVRDRQALRPFIGHLDGPEEPHDWPRALKWTRYRDKWLEYRRAAMAFAKRPQDTAHICPEAINYGAPTEVPDATNQEPVYCLGGKTRQKYWRVRTR